MSDFYTSKFPPEYYIAFGFQLAILEVAHVKSSTSDELKAAVWAADNSASERFKKLVVSLDRPQGSMHQDDTREVDPDYTGPRSEMGRLDVAGVFLRQKTSLEILSELECLRDEWPGACSQYDHERLGSYSGRCHNCGHSIEDHEYLKELDEALEYKWMYEELSK